MEKDKTIKELHKGLSNTFWNYTAEYANHNGYREEKEITKAIHKRLNELEIIIKQLKEYYE